MYQVVGQWAAVSVLIHDFYLQQCHVGSVRFPAVRVLNDTQLDLLWFARCL